MDSNAYITKIAVALPNAPVSNEQMEGVLGLIAGKPSRARKVVLRSNGIQSRHYVLDPATGKPTHTNASLTAQAVRGLAGDGFELDQVDLLACGTTMADQLMPNHAVMVHGELKMAPCEVVAMSGICLSGLASIKYATLGVRSGEFNHAVATGSEVPSLLMRAKFFDEEVEARIQALEERPEIAFDSEFLRWMLSDGAGAVLVEPKPRAEGLSLKVEWILERSYANEMSACMYAGAIKGADGSLKGWPDFEPQEIVDRSVLTIKQDVRQLNDHIIHYTVEKGLQEVQRLKGLKPEQVDWFLPHYSSDYFRQRVYDGAKKVGFEIPFERWFTNLYQKGNTGSASIYIILEELLRSGRLKEGQRLLCFVPESGRFNTGYMLLRVTGPQGA